MVLLNKVLHCGHLIKSAYPTEMSVLWQKPVAVSQLRFSSYVEESFILILFQGKDCYGNSCAGLEISHQGFFCLNSKENAALHQHLTLHSLCREANSRAGEITSSYCMGAQFSPSTVDLKLFFQPLNYFRTISSLGSISTRG